MTWGLADMADDEKLRDYLKRATAELQRTRDRLARLRRRSASRSPSSPCPAASPAA